MDSKNITPVTARQLVKSAEMTFPPTPSPLLRINTSIMYDSYRKAFGRSLEPVHIANTN